MEISRSFNLVKQSLFVRTIMLWLLSTDCSIIIVFIISIRISDRQTIEKYNDEN